MKHVLPVSVASGAWLFLSILGACGGYSLPPAPKPPALAPSAMAALSADGSVAPVVLADVDAGPSATTGDGGDSDGSSAALTFKMTPVALPGANGAVSLDYLAIDRSAGRVFIPAGGTGNLDVIDASTKQITALGGFTTVERTMRGAKRLVGTSSATVGDGVVYVGNRANAEVCAVDEQAMTKGACVTLHSAPDGLLYVASAKELWATTPKDSAIVVLDATTPAKLAVKKTIALPGKPEGYAVDDVHGIFFTNLEDKDKTLAIDVRAHTVTATWEPECGEDGPRGLAVDPANQILFVACTDHVESLDIVHNGGLVSQLDTGAGVDNIDYVPSRQELFAVAGKEGKLTVAHADEKGALTALATATTSPGTRVVVADAQGNAYVADGALARILVMTASAQP